MLLHGITMLHLEGIESQCQHAQSSDRCALKFHLQGNPHVLGSTIALKLANKVIVHAA